MYTAVLVRYGEISLKGKNRGDFEKCLLNNIREALSDLPSRKIEHTFGRIFVKVNGDAKEVIERLKRVFGIVSLSPVIETSLNIEAFREKALYLLKNTPGQTFKVETKRSNKRFPYQSPEVNRLVGGYLLACTGHPVDVHNPDRVIHIEIREEAAYLYSQVIPGPGGLPVGITGRGILLISGGLDSPVAGWLGLKRGLKISGLHFYSFPFTSERSKEKVIDLCRVLARYGGDLRLLIAPFTAIQKAIRTNCPEELYITIMRRMMFRIAKKVAEQEGALALLTGESLGQVASQTLESIAVINKVVDLPVLRPLISWDKTEIMNLARKIGTYDISIKPYEDCCTLFIPRHPATKPRLAKVEKAEEKLNVEGLIKECLDNLEVMEITP
ncbi:thiamine biosynthesis protein ThiI [Thermanaeromonas toyohensis ToBE]|uniref:Probable tRNA sulfurtransferase n=1 Tax=Thermanaeromonas toyohensis ToBE TaxID=698762 RepID=A0A1W1VDF4_9FIRM|nr:tRNA uracil 4-sulfurtransferase ThiI [Thermanaeromonas toyohensis]SMB91346.1 thiamine biosynthesis protein ThiI [Thermanaeromonas toyohensis ToBE]